MNGKPSGPRAATLVLLALVVLLVARGLTGTWSMGSTRMAVTGAGITALLVWALTRRARSH